MTETILVRLAAQLDFVSDLIESLQEASKSSLSEPIKEELSQTIKLLKLKHKKLYKQYGVAYKEMLELADFLSSVEY